MVAVAAVVVIAIIFFLSIPQWSVELSMHANWLLPPQQHMLNHFIEFHAQYECMLIFIYLFHMFYAYTQEVEVANFGVFVMFWTEFPTSQAIFSFSFSFLHILTRTERKNTDSQCRKIKDFLPCLCSAIEMHWNGSNQSWMHAMIRQIF